MNYKLGIRVDEVGTNGDFWDTLRRKGHGYPEQDLLLAVLKDALVNYRKNLRRTNKTAHADRAWIFDQEADRLFSFESVCAALGLSAERIRQQLTRLGAGISTHGKTQEKLREGSHSSATYEDEILASPRNDNYEARALGAA